MARKSAPSDVVLTILPDSAQRIPSGPRVNRNRLMPGLRVRHDGWTEERTQRFLMRWAIPAVCAMRRGWRGFPMRRRTG